VLGAREVLPHSWSCSPDTRCHEFPTHLSVRFEGNTVENTRSGVARIAVSVGTDLDRRSSSRRKPGRGFGMVGTAYRRKFSRQIRLPRVGKHSAFRPSGLLSSPSLFPSPVPIPRLPPALFLGICAPTSAPSAPARGGTGSLRLGRWMRPAAGSGLPNPRIPMRCAACGR
jgi:hypothetical protein